MNIQLHFSLDGRSRAELVDSGATLLTLLREQLGLTSVKQGCRQGSCGACTVIVDGQPRLACMTMAATCEGARVQTIESLGVGLDLHPLQRAFMDRFASQCGFCTTGMLMAAKALLDVNPRPSREDVEDAISGNICRCTGYEPIIEAVLDAAGGAPDSRRDAR